MSNGVEDDFYYTPHKKIFTVIRKIWSGDMPVDVVVIAEELKRHKWLEAVGDYPYLAQLCEKTASSVNINPYIDILRGYRTYRRLLDEALKIVGDVDSSKDAKEVLEQAQGRILEITTDRDKGKMYSGGDLCAEYALRSDDLVEGALTGAPTGYRELDALTGGFQKSDLVIVAGRPSMGKSAFGLGIAWEVSFQGGSVAVFSLEQSRRQVIERLICIDSGVSLVQLRSGRLEKEEQRKVSESMSRIDGAKIWVNDESGLSVSQILANCRRLKRQHGLSMVVVDYLQLCSGPGDNREQQISNISRGFKEIAKSLDIPVIALSQMSREVEKGKDKEPQLWHLRDSGAIEQDADVVIMMYRPEYYKIINTKVRHSDGSTSTRNLTGVGYAFVRKQRNGPIGDVELFWNRSAVRYEESKSQGGEW
jgi:replicative DNA helicase